VTCDSVIPDVHMAELRKRVIIFCYELFRNTRMSYEL